MGRRVAVYGDCRDGRGWLVRKIQRGDGGSDVAWWESRGVALDRRDGGEKRFLLFFFR